MATKLPTAQELVSAYKAGGPLTAAQITGAAPFSGGGTTAVNPKDAPGYNPATDPLSSAYGRTPTPTAPTAAPTTPMAPTIPPTAPAAAQVTPPNAQMDMAAAIAGKGAPLTSAEMASPQTIQDLAGQYKAGLAKMTGTQAPTTQGQAMAGVQGAMPQAQAEPPSIIGGIIETDANFDSILTMYDDFMSPATQRQTLMEEYAQLSSSLGIEQMNAELIDSKRIIEGTEDDIRSEITAAGGFGTESQVLALANARNKSLIKNYNYLLDSRNNATTQLTTMMNLSIQDRQMAQAEFDTKMNFAFKVAEFQQTATNNARTNYNNIVSAIGYNGLLASTNGDPYQQSLIEKTLGLGVGGLQRMATLPPSLKEQLLTEQIKTEQAQRAKIYAGMEKEVAPVADVYQQERSTRILQSTAELRDRVGVKTVGLIGLGLSKIGGTSARDFRADLDTLKANIFTGELTAMRAASKTGGAVGNVSDKEGDKLQSALGALDQGQSPASFKRNLQQIDDSIIRWYEALYGAGLTIAPDGSGNLIRITN